MPKYVFNKIKVKTDEDFNALCKKFIDKNENLDFNTVVPMPDTVENTASRTFVDEMERSIYWETAWLPTIEIAQNMSKVCTEPVYYQYAEEQFSEYVGEFIFYKGDVINQSESSGIFARYLLMQNPPLIRREFINRIFDRWDYQL